MASPITKQSEKNQVSTFKCPLCPYTRFNCVNYNSIFERAVCQSKGNQHAKLIRCNYLPSWVPNGLHIAVLRGGRLYV
jgi:hypothetical protein